MKYYLLLFTLVSTAVLANPEIGRQVHFVMNVNNADQEFKLSAGSECTGGVFPNGNGTAFGQIQCSSITVGLPWRNVSAIANDLNVRIIGIQDMPGTPCELFDYSNNAGNNQGYNVTQYNSNTWVAEYKATKLSNNPSKYYTSWEQRCYQGQQQ